MMAEQLSIDRGKTAILIMDYQNRQLNSITTDSAAELLTRANEVLAKARHESIPIIYIEVRRGERTPETEIHPAITPQPEELVLTKRRVGPFSTTNLDEVLKQQGIEALILMGIATSGCVLSTVRWAADIDYRIIVISDCCADRDEEVHRVLTEKIFPRQATVVTAEEFHKALGNGQ
jgi:nicotinamidase-related amidase